jgi:hypothetical protein
MRREVGQFAAKADDGRIFTIVEYQDFINAGTLEDPHATDPGLTELFTSEGEKVIFKYSGTYEIVSSGLIVHRIP